MTSVVDSWMIFVNKIYSLLDDSYLQEFKKHFTLPRSIFNIQFIGRIFLHLIQHFCPCLSYLIVYMKHMQAICLDPLIWEFIVATSDVVHLSRE